jgi:hypothetical protein
MLHEDDIVNHMVTNIYSKVSLCVFLATDSHCYSVNIVSGILTVHTHFVLHIYFVYKVSLTRCENCDGLNSYWLHGC